MKPELALSRTTEMSRQVTARLFEFIEQLHLEDEPSEWDTISGEIFVKKKKRHSFSLNGFVTDLHEIPCSFWIL